MEKPKILISEKKDFSPKAIEILSEKYQVVFLVSETIEELEANIHDIEILFVRLKHFISKNIIDKALKLKFILTATTGLDHIDYQYFQSKGGRIVALKGEFDFLNSIPSTAEHTWALLLALYRHLPQAYNHVNQGYWNRDLFKGNNLRHKKIGILGIGRIGKQIARFAAAFQMEIGYYDTDSQKNIDGIKFDSASDLASWCDILSIHIPLSSENTHFIDENIISQLHKDAVVINTSRGAVVKESALYDAIIKYNIAGYATDVLENEIEGIENNSIHYLAKNNYNVIITPHISGATYESMYATENFIVNKLFNQLETNSFTIY